MARKVRAAVSLCARRELTLKRLDNSNGQRSEASQQILQPRPGGASISGPVVKYRKRVLAAAATDISISYWADASVYRRPYHVFSFGRLLDSANCSYDLVIANPRDLHRGQNRFGLWPRFRAIARIFAHELHKKYVVTMIGTAMADVGVDVKKTAAIPHCICLSRHQRTSSSPVLGSATVVEVRLAAR